MSEEKDRIIKLIRDNEERWKDQTQDEDPGVDYAIEYQKQTGRDLTTGKYVVQ